MRRCCALQTWSRDAITTGGSRTAELQLRPSRIDEACAVRWHCTSTSISRLFTARKRAKESQAVVQRFSPTLNCLKVWPCLLQVPIIRDCFVAPVHLLKLIAEEVLFLFEDAWFRTETFWVSFEVVPVSE
jgi:hypothetical protein